MTQRYCSEGGTLALLVQADQAMAGHAELLRQTLGGKTATWILENAQPVRDSIDAVRMALTQRHALLRFRSPLCCTAK